MHAQARHDTTTGLLETSFFISCDMESHILSKYLNCELLVAFTHFSSLMPDSVKAPVTLELVSNVATGNETENSGEPFVVAKSSRNKRRRSQIGNKNLLGSDEVDAVVPASATRKRSCLRGRLESMVNMPVDIFVEVLL